MSAFAQNAVSIYGSMDAAYVTKTHTAGDGTTLSKLSGIGEGFNAGNRIGFLGSEDLGGGVTAGFRFETGVNLTSSTGLASRASASGQQYEGLQGASGNMPAASYSTGTTRQSYVSIADNRLGELRMGYQYNNLYTLSTNSGYMLGSEQPGSDVAHLVGNSDFGGTRSAGLTYMTPKMGAFQLTYQHGAVGSNRETQEFSSAAVNTANGRTQDNSSRDSFLLDYANGPLKTSAAYTKVQVKQSVGTNQATCTVVPTVGGTPGTATCVTNYYTYSILNAATYASAVPAPADYDSNLAQLGARYDMGSMRFAGTYNKGTKSNTGGTTVSTNAYQAGVEGVFGAMRPYFKMGKAKVSTDGAATNSYKESQLGIRYDLSKRTLVYVITGSVKDDVVLSSSASIARRAATAFGLYHSF